MGEDAEKSCGHVICRFRRYFIPLVELEVEGGATENCEPDECQKGRDQQRSENKFPNRPAPRNTCHEKSDERSPGDPGGTEKERPVPGPPIPFVRIGVETHGQKGREIVAQGCYQYVENEGGRSDEKHRKKQGRRDPDVRSAEDLNAAVKASHGGYHVHDSNHGDDGKPRHLRVLDEWKDIGQTTGNLHGSQAEGGRGHRGQAYTFD